MKNSGIELYFNDAQRRSIALPAVIISLVLHLSLIVRACQPDLLDIQRWACLGEGLVGIPYIFLVFFLLFPRVNKSPSWIWVIAVANAFFTIIAYILQPYTIPNLFFLLVVIFVIATAIIAGRWATYLYVFIIIVLQHTIATAYPTLYPHSLLDNSIILVYAIISTEIIVNMLTIISRQVRRLELTRQIAHSLASTLEKNQVMAMVGNFLQILLPVDSYYVGIIKGQQILLEIFYDEGKYFKDTILSMDNTLAGWVIKQRKPLLVNDYGSQMETLGITRKIVGQPKLSQCWIGAPLIASGHTIGILVAASYKQHAFDSEDLNLLEDIANLTAMALDNSSHHATVKHQSQMDSLTNTLNHGSFITELDKAITLAQKDHHPLSVIMLDIDGFKAYNDQYGHLVGDEVLIVLAETIALDIKSTDFIGRWGGEEFAIALPHTNREQAHIAAERVRTSVKDLKLFDREGNNIQPPTVCQGIAFFPDEAGDSFNLIDVADQRLYVAKKRGRDQIESDEHTLTKNN